MRRFIKISIHVLLILLVSFFLSIVGIIIWLNGEQKKVPANVVSRFENAFEVLSPNLQVYIGGAKAKFLSLEKGFEVVLNDSYIQFGSDVLASAPKMRVEIKLKDLIFFDVKLGELRLYDPQFVVSSTSANSSSQFKSFTSEVGFLSTYKSIVYELFAAINKENNVIPVEKVDMEGAKFSFNNQGNYETWDLRRASLRFFKLQNSTYLQTDIQTKIYDDIVDFSSKARLLEGDRMMVEVDFQNVPSKITTIFVDDVDWLKDLDINLSGKSKVVMQKDSAESSFSLDTGFVFNKKGLGDIELDYNGELNLVSRDKIITPVLKSGITLKKLEMSKLKDLWPENYGGDIRDEVLKRISKGVYDDVKISFEFAFENMDFEEIISEDYSFAANITGADVIFNPLYPTIKSVDGYFEFDGDNVFGNIKKAKIRDGLNFANTRLDISNINSDVSIMEIEGSISGDIIAVKHIVSSAMKGRDKEFFYNTRNIKAVGEGTFYYKDDINNGFSYEHTKLNVKANSTDFKVENVVDNVDFSSNSADIVADENGIDIKSEGILNSSPAYVSVWAGFKGENNYTVKLNTQAKEDDIAKLVKDYDQYVIGNTDLEFEYKSNGKTNSLIGKLDFLESEVNFPYISWLKKKGEFAVISFTGRNADFRALEIKNLQLTTSNSVSSGRAIIALEKGAPNEVYFSRLRAGENDVELYYSSSAVTDKKKNILGYADIVKVTGQSFNANGLINNFKSSATSAKSSLTLDVNVDNLKMSNGEVFNNFEAHLKCGMNQCLTGNATGKFASGGNMIASFYPKSQKDVTGERLFELETDDAGTLARAFGITENIKRGYSKITSVTDANSNTSGDILIKDYQIVKAPILAKIFSLASFSGISELLTGSGIPMKKLTGKFRMNNDFMSFEDIRSYGDSLGITAQGRYNLKSSEIDVSGAVTPSYSINSFLGKIPVLGRIFTANEGEGLIAAKYSLKGKHPDIDVSVNPLSALTPGFLRNIWGNSSTELESEEDSERSKRKYPSK